jgi:hypothetical protein
MDSINAPRVEPSRSSRHRFRPAFADAVGFWEPRRLVYNLVLGGVVMTWIVASWPHFRPALTLDALLAFAVLGLLANLCYCAAYLVDIPMLLSGLGAGWKRRRWILWLLGMIVAFILTNYWIADEVYPYVSNVRG